MKVALTGATGFIGSHVLTELHEHGHEVTALVRDDTQADIVKARGATPAVADLYDRPAVVSLLEDADGAIHTASPGDATTADMDSAVADAVIEAFAGTWLKVQDFNSSLLLGEDVDLQKHATAIATLVQLAKSIGVIRHEVDKDVALGDSLLRVAATTKGLEA